MKIAGLIALGLVLPVVTRDQAAGGSASVAICDTKSAEMTAEVKKCTGDAAQKSRCEAAARQKFAGTCVTTAPVGTPDAAVAGAGGTSTGTGQGAEVPPPPDPDATRPEVQEKPRAPEFSWWSVAAVAAAALVAALLALIIVWLADLRRAVAALRKDATTEKERAEARHAAVLAAVGDAAEKRSPAAEIVTPPPPDAPAPAVDVAAPPKPQPEPIAPTVPESAEPAMTYDEFEALLLAAGNGHTAPGDLSARVAKDVAAASSDGGDRRGAWLATALQVAVPQATQLSHQQRQNVTQFINRVSNGELEPIWPEANAPLAPEYNWTPAPGATGNSVKSVTSPGLRRRDGTVLRKADVVSQ